MSDTATNDLAATTGGGEVTDVTPAPAPAPSPDGFFLDGDAPRLGAVAVQAPKPEERSGPAPAVVPTTGAGGPSLMSPVLQSEEASPRPDQPALPTLPAAPAKVSGGEAPTDENDADDAEPSHPMAHLMPQKSAPSESSRRAAEIRAAKKAKSRKITMMVSGGILVVTAVVGPPLFKWLSNAINEAGSTSTEQPAE